MDGDRVADRATWRIVARDGAITAIEFSPFRTSPSAAPLGTREDDDPLLRSAVEQLAAYFARDLKEFDLPLAPRGSAFQQRVWEQLRTIGYGETASYGEIARRLGKTNAASRAVGPRQRAQPDPDRDPVPPGDRGRRHPHGLRGRPRAQAAAPGAGAGRPVLTRLSSLDAHLTRVCAW